MRVPDRAAAVGDAPGADAVVGHVGACGKPAERLPHVGDLARPVDRHEPAGVAVAPRVDGEHRVLVAWEERLLGERVHPLPVATEPVEEHDRRPASCGHGAVRDVQRRGQGQPIARRDGHVLLRPRRGDAGPGERCNCDEEGKRAPHGARRVAPHSYNRLMDRRPLGVFDSGMGGLTVLHECLVTLPHEDFVYVGDGARLPYGPRPADEIRRFAREIAGFLEGQGVKLIVAACNSATSASLPELQEQLSVPIIGVLEPEAHAAVQATRNRRIGLLATEATVASGRYEQLVRTLDAGAAVASVACPALVPLIESDDPFGEETVAAVREYAAPLKDAGVDTVILGCTHYPLIRPIFQRVFGRGVTLVFSAEETAREVAETLARKGIEAGSEREGSYRFLTTGDVDLFRTMGARFLQLPIGAVEHVDVADLERVAA